MSTNGDWALWTEEIDGFFHRIAVHRPSCPSLMHMLRLITEGDALEEYTLTEELTMTDVMYLHNTQPLRFVDTDTPSALFLSGS